MQWTHHQGLHNFDAQADMQDTHFTLLHVTDPEISVRFYSGLLDRPPLEASATFAMFALGAGSMLGLWQRKAVEPTSAGVPGSSELAFAVESRAAVDARCARWQRLGCKVLQAPTAMDFGYTFTVEDPDGHRLRVFSPEGS
jgi:predicted enzyme related to lactoylglutathione lyase